MDNADYCLKSKFLDYFSKNNTMTFGGMYFRLYDSGRDDVVKNYMVEDWNKIFKNTTEDDLRDLSNCENVVILLWCDIETDTPHGMLYFEEEYNHPFEVVFHGGTWNHSMKYHRDIFRSIVNILDFILSFKTSISTTCGIDNNRADKFQESLCFEEIKRDESTMYKVLDKQKYAESCFVKMMRLHN